MWQNKKVVIIGVLTAVVLAAGIGGAVYAKSGGNIGAGNIALNQAANVTSANDTLMARVAKILGIDQQKLQDAVKQASGDMQKAQVDKYLQNLITQGKITQAQADKFTAWLAARPTGPQTTIQQIKDWMAARPTDVPLPRGFAGAGCGGPGMGAAMGAGPVNGGLSVRGGMITRGMGRF